MHQNVSVDFLSVAKVYKKPGRRNSVTLSLFGSSDKGLSSLVVDRNMIFLDAPDGFCKT